MLHVVVLGAGPLGIMNLFAAREYGASKLILAQREGKRLELARGFAWDRLVNTTRENLLEVVRGETGGLGADCRSGEPQDPVDVQDAAA